MSEGKRTGATSREVYCGQVNKLLSSIDRRTLRWVASRRKGPLKTSKLNSVEGVKRASRFKVHPYSRFHWVVRATYFPQSSVA